MKNAVMFENYPDVVEVMISAKCWEASAENWPIASWLIKRSVAFESVEPIKSRKSV